MQWRYRYVKKLGFSKNIGMPVVRIGARIDQKAYDYLMSYEGENMSEKLRNLIFDCRYDQLEPTSEDVFKKR